MLFFSASDMFVGTEKNEARASLRGFLHDKACVCFFLLLFFEPLVVGQPQWKPKFPAKT